MIKKKKKLLMHLSNLKSIKILNMLIIMQMEKELEIIQFLLIMSELKYLKIGYLKD
jgi:hypothetical protein